MKHFRDMTDAEIREWAATKIMGWKPTYLGVKSFLRYVNAEGERVMEGWQWKPDQNMNQLRDCVVKVCGTDADKWVKFAGNLPHNLNDDWTSISAYPVMTALTNPRAVLESLWEMTR